MGLIRYSWSGDEIVPAVTAPKALDDGDFWGGVARCGVAVAIAASVVPFRPAFADDSDVPVSTAVSQPDEDLFLPPAPVQGSFQRLYLPDADDTAGFLHGQPDEDFWQNQVPPLQATLYQRLPLGDPEELPAGFLRGVPEEDAYRPPVFGPAPPVLAFTDDEVWVQPAAAPTIVDEDFWLPPVPPTRPPPVQAFLDDEIWVAPPATIAEEDFWAFPAPSTPWLSRAFSDTDDIVPQPAPGQPDEDYWTLGPSPVMATLYQRLPYLPDPEEIPAGSLVPPVRPLYAIFYFHDEEEYVDILRQK